MSYICVERMVDTVYYQGISYSIYITIDGFDNMPKSISLFKTLFIALFGLTLPAFSISTPFAYPQGKLLKVSDAKLIITHAYIRKDQSDRFYSLSMKIAESLKNRPGLLAYSVRRQLFGNQAWTLTLWDSESSVSFP